MTFNQVDLGLKAGFWANYTLVLATIALPGIAGWSVPLLILSTCALLNVWWGDKDQSRLRLLRTEHNGLH